MAYGLDRRFILWLVGSFLLFSPLSLLAQASSPRHEFRGVWIASVDNIDWPLKKGLPSDSQKAQYLRQLDLHKANGMNAVIVQVRPAADALYPSPLEPWSEWLTGRQGKPPQPYYDPLEFMIAEAHRRGLEFHAWCNPYRAVYQRGVSSIAPNHITRTRPEWFLDYGDKRYFDPGIPEVRAYVVSVVEDIVRRYPVDAIHFDDYFYPYRIPGRSFPDSASFRLYGRGMSLDDWRRSNVDSIILDLRSAIRAGRPGCRFGISPFGVWRNQDKDPEGSATRAGQTNYDDLYADIRLWLKNDWIDYVAPQLYWEFGHRAAAYETLIEWWNRNSFGKPCYIGIGYYKAGSNAIWRDKTLLPRQLRLLRQMPQLSGAIFFSSRNFLTNPLGWNDSLRNAFYSKPALIAPLSESDTIKPSSPVLGPAQVVGLNRVSFTVKSAAPGASQPRLTALYQSSIGDSSLDKCVLLAVEPFQEGMRMHIELSGPTDSLQLICTVVDHLNRESDPFSEHKPTIIRAYRNRQGQWSTR